MSRANREHCGSVTKSETPVTDKDFYTVMIESEEPEESFVQLFWTHANHPGEAIDKILRACAGLGIENAFASEFDISEFKALLRKTFHDKKFDAYYAPERYGFSTEETFRTPAGIIESFAKGELDFALIKEGFCQNRFEAGSYAVELVVENQRLFSTFVEFANCLESSR